MVVESDHFPDYLIWETVRGVLLLISPNHHSAALQVYAYYLIILAKKHFLRLELIR